MAEHPAAETTESKADHRTPRQAECVEAVMVGTYHRDKRLRVSGNSADVAGDNEGLGTRLRCGDTGVIDHLLTEVGPEMQRRLFQKYQGALRAEEAEDVLMIAMQKLWTHRLQFDAVNGTLDGWLWRIADNTAKDVIRTAWCRARCLEDDLESDRLDDLCERAVVRGVADALSADPTSDTLAHLKEALARLPEGQRRVLLADARSPEGTAETPALADDLGISASAVRTRRQRALTRLRHDLAGTPPPEKKPSS